LGYYNISFNPRDVQNNNVNSFKAVHSTYNI